MPTKNPRVNVVLERPLYTLLHDLADHEGVSMSMLIRDLVREAVELREDRALCEFAEERESVLNLTKTLTHDEAWE
jgi:predicted DNA-binding ribbon-helix-helix protein